MWHTYAHIKNIYIHLYLFWLKRPCYQRESARCRIFGVSYDCLVLLCVACRCTSCGAGGLCLWACSRVDYARRGMSSHFYWWDIYVVCGFYPRMIANDSLPSVFMCFLFVIFWNWTGENRFVVFFSDKCYFIWFASVTWHFVKVDFVKKTKRAFI